MFGAGLYFSVRLRFRQGAVAPQQFPPSRGVTGARIPPIPKASASFVKSLSKLDGKLVGRYLHPFYTPWQGFLTILARNPCLHPGNLAINQSRAAQYRYSKNLPPEADHDAVPTPPGRQHRQEQGNGRAWRRAARSQPQTPAEEGDM